MMNCHKKVEVRQERCNGCGLCVRVCPKDCLHTSQGVIRYNGQGCLACGHCEAACPQGAIRVAGDGEPFCFSTFAGDARWLPPGAYDVAGLVRLMRARRSCRNFSTRPLANGVLEDLVKIGTTAPSGTNSQAWTFTVLSSRGEVEALGRRMADFFRRLNRLSGRPLLRFLLRLAGRPELDAYHREHAVSVSVALEDWERQGRDRLFHGAPALIIIGSAPGASCPKEDALCAAQNILLAAHAMGCGTCLVGYAVEALNRDASLKKFLTIPGEEAIHAVIALGYPDERYQRPAARRRVIPRFPLRDGVMDGGNG